MERYNEDISINLLKTDKYSRLLECIPVGKENAKHLGELAQEQNLSIRDYQDCLNNLRKSGYLIVSDNNGIYYPLNNEDIRKFYFSKRKLAISILTMLKPTRLYLKENNLLEIKKENSKNGTKKNDIKRSN